MNLMDSLIAAVPQGKALAWILGGMAATFGAGFGIAFGLGERAENVDAIPVLRSTVAENSSRIESIQSRLADIDQALQAGRDADRRILCLAGLTATGEIVLPTYIDERCP